MHSEKEKKRLKNKYIWLSPAAIIGIIVLFFVSLIAHTHSPEVNQKITSFTLKNTQNETIDFEIFRQNKVVLLNFWATWCKPCTDELPLLEKLHQHYKADGFTVLAINIDDDVESAHKMIENLKLTLPIAFDREQSVVEQFHITIMPTTYLIDRKGKIRHLHHGFFAHTEQTYETQIINLLSESNSDRQTAIK